MAQTEARRIMVDLANQKRDAKELLSHFESLGGSGHGSEFGMFQVRCGYERLGLLSWASLNSDLLALALEERFQGVGNEENTLFFHTEGSDEWWSRDRRYCMAMRSSMKLKEMPSKEAHFLIRQRQRALRERLIFDLEAGDKIFVFDDTASKLEEPVISRLHAAVRSYGPSTLLYLQSADLDHPPGMVEAVAPGLFIGYVANADVSPEDQPLAKTDPALIQLCRQARALHTTSGLPKAAPENQAKAAYRGGRRPKRRIVMVGNCQIEAMAWLYRRFVAPRSGDIIEIVQAQEAKTTARRQVIENADIIVEQVTDLAPDQVTSATPRILMPLVTGSFLWPFRAESHPSAISYPFLSTGPFSSELSDSYLNRLIIAGIDPEQAAERYENLDMGQIGDLDGLYQLAMDQQRTRDAASGFQIADVIAEHFRSEHIFLTPDHPNVRVSLTLARDLFRRLGADASDIERMESQTRIMPFPASEAPIHPSVARHWGLTYVTPDHRYRFRHEGSVTFHEFARRYMAYEWNARLEEGIWLSHQCRDAAAIQALREGLVTSPNAPYAYTALAEAYRRSGDQEGALAAIKASLALDPSHAATHSANGAILCEAARLEEAEQALTTAITLDPTEPQYCLQLAQVRRARDDLPGSAAAWEQALELNPHDTAAWGELASIYDAMGNASCAVQALQRAIDVDEDATELHHRLAKLLGRLEGNPALFSKAETPGSRAHIPIHPRILHVQALLREGAHQAALTEAYRIALAAPHDARCFDCIGEILRDQGDLEAAEQAFHRSINLEPERAHFRHQLSALLLQQNRMQEAIENALQAIDLEPGNPFRRAYLADLYTVCGAFAQARSAVEHAISIMPDHIDFRIKLSETYAQEGRINDAITEAVAIIRDAPSDAAALGHLAHLEALAVKQRAVNGELPGMVR